MTEKAGVHIGQLNLRMPGSDTDSAQRVAGAIVERLAQTVPAGLRRHLGALSVRVQLRAGASESDMSDAVTGAIVKALRKR